MCLKTIKDNIFIWNPSIHVECIDGFLFISNEEACYKLNLNTFDIDSDNLYRNLITGINKKELTNIELNLINKLYDKKMVSSINKDYDINIMSDKNIGYLSHIVSSPTLSLNKIKNSTVAIIGIGGTGSIILQNLVGMGIKNYIILDSDHVNKDNFNRQFIYKNKQINEYKVDSASDYIRERVDNPTIHKYHHHINNQNDLVFLKKHQNIDIIINCVDTPIGKIENLIYDFCWNNKIPTIAGALGISYAHWGPLICENRTKSFTEWSKLMNIKNGQSGSKPMNWSFGPTNTIISSIISKDIIEFLAGSSPLSLGKRCIIDFRTMDIQKSKSIALTD